MRSWNARATFTASCKLFHQRLVDLQTACRIEDDDVAAVRLRAVDAVAHRLDGVGALLRVDGNAHLAAELDELIDRGRALQVGGDERRLLTVALQEKRQLAGRRRLAGALETREQNRRRRALRERDLRGAGAHQRRQLLVHDLHDLLPRGQALLDVLAERPFADLSHELFDDVEVDVGLEQREPHLAHGTGDRLVVQRAAALEVAERALQLVGEGVEHGLLSVVAATLRLSPHRGTLWA
jgi:hypothetical protein